MTISSKEVLKRYFETGDRPTQSQFADMFDSLVIVPGASAAAVTPGLVEVESTAKSTARSLGAFGASFISLSTTAAAHNHLGAATVGQAIYQAATTAAARTIIGVVSGGTVGQALYEATTTAAAQQTLGGGTVGRQIYEVATTAAAQNIVGGNSAFSTYAESSELGDFTAAALRTWTHGLGGAPKGYQIYLRCKTAEGGFSINDEVQFPDPHVSTQDRGAIAWASTTQINLRIGGGTTLLLNQGSGVSFTATAANWQVFMRAWR